MNLLNPVFETLRRKGVLAIQTAKPNFPNTVIYRMRTERPMGWRQSNTQPRYYLGAGWAFPADLKKEDPIIRYIGGGQGLKSNRLTTQEVGVLLEKELFCRGFEIFGHGDTNDDTGAKYISLVFPI